MFVLASLYLIWPVPEENRLPHMQRCANFEFQAGEFETKNHCAIPIYIQFLAEGKVITQEVGSGERFRGLYAISRVFAACPAGHVSSIAVRPGNYEKLFKGEFHCVRGATSQNRSEKPVLLYLIVDEIGLVPLGIIVVSLVLIVIFGIGSSGGGLYNVAKTKVSHSIAKTKVVLGTARTAVLHTAEIKVVPHSELMILAWVLLILLLVIQVYVLYLWIPFAIGGGGNPLLISIYLGLSASIPGVIATIWVVASPTRKRMSTVLALVSFAWFSFAIYLIPSLCEAHVFNITSGITYGISTLDCYWIFLTYPFS